MLNPEEIAIRQRLKDDFIHYASRCLKIRSKSGAIVPLQMNRAQIYLHQQLEAQKQRTGKVRAIVLKGRQQGCSTYIGGRFFHIVTHSHGIRADILTHEQQATDNLFDMTQRYYDNCPDTVKPHCGGANAKELYFDKLDCVYKTHTAGTKGVGRSATIQLLHCSEVAFWPNAETHAQGIMQAVPDEPGTEIIKESTANGENNLFHQEWQLASKGQSEYLAIFIPWYWTPEYRKPTDDSFLLTEEELLLKETYGLDNMQLAWRRAKITEFSGDASLFKQEYPFTADEAFQTSGENIFIDVDVILRARKETTAKATGPLLIGVDPARFGDDRTAIMRRQGRVAFGKETHRNKDTMEVAGIVARIINQENPTKVFVDIGGLGAGIYDRLVELGYRSILIPVNAGEKSSSPRYLNKRAEFWGEMKEWLLNGPVQIPDDDELQADLRAPRFKYTSNQAVQLERKEDMKKRGVSSPDIGDALALTFAYPVFTPKDSKSIKKPLFGQGGNAWSAL